MSTPIVPKYFSVVKSDRYAIDVWYISVTRSEVLPHDEGGFRLHHGVDHFEFAGGRAYDKDLKMEYFIFKVKQTDEDGYIYVDVGIPNPEDHLTLIESLDPGEYHVALIPRKK